MHFLAFADVQLVPDGTLFIHIALILLMIWILNRTFFRPINRILEAREKNKGGQFGESDRLLGEVADKDAKYQQALLEARNDGYELIENERTDALAAKLEALTAAKFEIHSQLTDELVALEKETGDARLEISKEAEKMADKISANILKA